MTELPAPKDGLLLTHFIVSTDVERSRRFYTDVLGGELVIEGEPTIVQLANGWVIINVGGGPTDDKPAVTLEAPHDPNRVSSFLNVRVADIAKVYEFDARGAEFLTEPKDHRRDSLLCALTRRHPDRGRPGNGSPQEPLTLGITRTQRRGVATHGRCFRPFRPPARSPRRTIGSTQVLTRS